MCYLRTLYYEPLLRESAEEGNINSTNKLRWHCLGKWLLYGFVLTLFMHRWSFVYVENFDNFSINGSFTDQILSNDTHAKIFRRLSRQIEFFMNTSHCHIPYVDPLTPEIKKIFKPHYSTDCGNKDTLVKLWFDENAQQYILHMDTDALQDYKNLIKNVTNPIEKLKCCYRQIVRSGSGAKADDKYKLLPCSNFHQDFMVPPHIESLVVDCKWDNSTSILQQNVFYLVQVKNRTIQESPTSATTRKPAILLIGIDSLSRINVRRTLPQTFQYLEENNWFELLGYTKVGDNTFPNLMALLTGQNLSTAESTCKPKMVGGLDKCDFIWKKFKAQGYYTAYAEDCETLSTFNYIKKGFEHPPSDYYFRPTGLALENAMKPTKKAGLVYCIANRQYGEYIYDMGVQFALRFQDEPYFGLFWTNSFSHNDFKVISTMDLKMLNYFKELEAQGTLDTSIVVFFSDHGFRWGDLLDQPEGFLEQRLPMFFISLPTWFRNQYPDIVQHLTINCQRLTTPYDIYMTFQHLLKLNDPNFNTTSASGCLECQSVFEEIPENRTCSQAGIPDTWCTCTPLKVVSTKDEIVTNITSQVIKEINDFIKKKELSKKCSTLKLHSIKDAKMRYIDEDSRQPTYVIEFDVEPKTNPRAKFSATANYDKQTYLLNITMADITRSSKYENTAKCVEDIEAKKYCLCK